MDELINKPQKLVHAYDAFISYNSKDMDIVEIVSRELEDCGGLSIWKDNWELTGGDDWIDALPEAIVRSRSLVAFVGSNGLGPWHKEEIKVALRRAIEQNTVRVIPVALPGAPQNLTLPEFLRSKHAVDLRKVDGWSLHLLRCAIVGARPGRQDQFSKTYLDHTLSRLKYSRIHIVDWSISSMRVSYDIKCRVANVCGNQSIIIKTVFVRTHQVAPHPIETSLPTYLAPIGKTCLRHTLTVPNTRKAVMHTLEQGKYLVPGEVEDILIPLDVPIGLRAVISFGMHWLISHEPLYRLSETGYLAIGQRGTPGCPPEEQDSYSPGQHNLDKPRSVSSPDWPLGWPNEVSTDEWRHYGANEEQNNKKE